MNQARIPFFKLAPANMQAMIALSGTVKKSSLGPRLVELINLRISQINGCGVCVDMHWRDLIKQEVEPRHLNAIAGWREAPASFFSERERAALNWAEAVNALPHKHPGDADFDLLKSHFSDNEIAEMSYAIAVIRGWNVINASLHNQIPEVPPPGM
ncbi:alkylhydroperoxidase AhpD family core domain-containing protein [Duganella sacchari]|uniref:Alkylhydroperoxidase AhpD family core domain-containing protein n=1 Tax=Duganella sacchari TaxID=551987 RepID=A0A1M7R1Q7_9BURK|nr:carboxymuconolactone decarboxylase family protein [Duganella sacchari]SHN38502.1 alkylhydroperoxidase AhpD family core domain-containing protein [Duganella sacchari]